MTDVLFDQYGHPVNILVDPDHPEKLFDDYGRPFVVVKDASGLDLAAYNAIQVLAKRGIYIPAITYNGFNKDEVGSGAGHPEATGYYVKTDTTPESSCIAYGIIGGSPGGGYYSINWDRAAIFNFHLQRAESDPQAVAYVQLKSAGWPPPIGDMAAQGLGLKVVNYALYGESYGTERGEVNLATSLVNNQLAEIEIVLTPGVRIEWKINGVSRGIQETPSKIPTGSDGVYFCVAIMNGVTGGVNAQAVLANFSAWLSKV